MPRAVPAQPAARMEVSDTPLVVFMITGVALIFCLSLRFALREFGGNFFTWELVEVLRGRLLTASFIMIPICAISASLSLANCIEVPEEMEGPPA